MPNLRTKDQFTSAPALLGMGLIGLVLAYALVSRAIDSGSLWLYLVALIVTVLSFRLLGRAVRRLIKL